MKRHKMNLTICLGFGAVFSLAAPFPALAQTYLGTNLRPFAVFGGTTVTCTGTSVITGAVGVSPGSATTGFPVPCAGVPVTPPASDPAKADLVAAFGTLAAMTCGSTIGPNLTGLTLVPGVYCVTAAASNLTGTLTLDAQGNSAANWVFQMASTLNTSPNSTVSFINGTPANSCGVQWLVNSSATLDTNTTFVGNILALTNITMNTGANLTGRALARNAAVNLNANNVSFAACTGEPVPTLPQWAMILLGVLLTAVGVTRMRRRTA
jgi:hypothetical protein